MKKISKKRLAVYLLLLSAIIFCAACIMYPEHAETVGRGFSVFINASLLLLGV